MKSLIAFAEVLISEAGERCGISTGRDIKTVTVRSEHEGSSFLTITLPQFAVDLQKGLAAGAVSHDQFAGYARTGGLPRFLGGFLDLVFDRKSGVLLESPNIEAIRCMRQISLTFAKIELKCSDARKAKAIRGYLECEQGVRSSDESFPKFLGDFTRISSMLFDKVFYEVDRKLELNQLVPKHGSGSTADLLLGNAKYDQLEWTTRLDKVFPVMDWLVPTYRHIEVLDRLTILEPGEERPVKVTLIPKTLKTPRIIAKEPTCMMYAQQALLEVVREAIARDDLLTSFIGNESQEPNKLLARLGSRDGSLATLDLSEASDRVSNQHVRALLAYHRPLFEAVDAVRSRKADVPDHGVIRLAKFASMGSALTFDFEAMIFLVMVFLGIEDGLNHTLSMKDIKSFIGKVRIYGDDIIVPVAMVQQVTNRLESFGMKVNTAKSYETGKFRESCGGDYYDGCDVSITKIRQVFPKSPQHADEIVSTVATRNLFWEAGWYNVCDFLDRKIKHVLPVFPVVADRFAGLGRRSFDPPMVGRINPDTQVPMIWANVAQDILPTSKVSGYGALMKFFLRRGEFMTLHVPKDHLQRAGRPVSVRIKTRWVSTV